MPRCLRRSRREDLGADPDRREGDGQGAETVRGRPEGTGNGRNKRQAPHPESCHPGGPARPTRRAGMTGQQVQARVKYPDALIGTGHPGCCGDPNAGTMWTHGEVLDRRLRDHGPNEYQR